MFVKESGLETFATNGKGTKGGCDVYVEPTLPSLNRVADGRRRKGTINSNYPRENHRSGAVVGPWKAAQEKAGKIARQGWQNRVQQMGILKLSHTLKWCWPVPGISRSPAKSLSTMRPFVGLTIPYSYELFMRQRIGCSASIRGHHTTLYVSYHPVCKGNHTKHSSATVIILRRNVPTEGGRLTREIIFRSTKIPLIFEVLHLFTSEWLTSSAEGGGRLMFCMP